MPSEFHVQKGVNHIRDSSVLSSNNQELINDMFHDYEERIQKIKAERKSQSKINLNFKKS